MSRSRWTIEVVTPSAIRRGDTLLHITRGRVYELRVRSNPKPLGDFAKQIEVCWPGEDAEHSFPLSRGAAYLRVVE